MTSSTFKAKLLALAFVLAIFGLMTFLVWQTSLVFVEMRIYDGQDVEGYME